jgi:hypothetical protein
VFNVMTTQLAIAAHIKEEDRRRYFRVDGGKANIAPPEKATWFNITPVLCKNGEDTPTVVSWKYPNVFDQVTTDHVTRIRAIAAEGRYRKDPRSEDWIGRPVAEMLGLDLKDEADRKQVNKILGTWFANGVLMTKEDLDDNRHKRVFVVPGNWTDAEQAAPASAPEPRAKVNGPDPSQHRPAHEAPLMSWEADELKARGFAADDLFNMSPVRARGILADPECNALTEQFGKGEDAPPDTVCRVCGKPGARFFSAPEDPLTPSRPRALLRYPLHLEHCRQFFDSGMDL